MPAPTADPPSLNSPPSSHGAWPETLRHTLPAPVRMALSFAPLAGASVRAILRHGAGEILPKTESHQRSRQNRSWHNNGNAAPGPTRPRLRSLQMSICSKTATMEPRPVILPSTAASPRSKRRPEPLWCRLR